jgi:hypothetical protein
VRSLVALLAIVFGPASVFAQASAASPTAEAIQHGVSADCLPHGVKLSDVVQVTAAESPGKPPHVLTVGEKLDQLRATCSAEKKLIDGSGRPIVFYHVIGCWGYPPPDYEELLQKQRVEVEQLKQQNTVIEMTCNPSGTRISKRRPSRLHSAGMLYVAPVAKL